MMLRQEATLDRSIDRKVRILLRLRKEFANPPIAPAGHDDGAKIGNIEGAPDSDMSFKNSQGVETVENLKMKERRGNVIEKKGVVGNAGGHQVEDLLEPHGVESALVEQARHLGGFFRPALLQQAD
jgi:hypothetical protein